MKEIALTKGYVTIVDDEDYESLSRYKWYASGTDARPARRLRTGERRIILLYHQVLYVLPWVLKSMGMCVDHIDRDPLNNQKINLRVVTHKENMRNTDTYGKRRGVGYDWRHNRYKAYIDRPDLPRINIGTFLTESEAEQALAKAKEELGLENN